MSDLYDSTHAVYTAGTSTWDFSTPIWYEQTNELPIFTEEGFIVYYVDAATGSDANAGGKGDPWLTIQKSMDGVAAGDFVWVKGGTDYTEDATGTTSGTFTNSICWEGYTATTGDGGKFTIDANGYDTSDILG